MGVGYFSRNAAQWDSSGPRLGNGKVFSKPLRGGIPGVAPFQGWEGFLTLKPERCPGLSHFALSGRRKPISG